MLPRYQKFGLCTTSRLKHDGLHALLNEASYDGRRCAGGRKEGESWPIGAQL